MKNKPNNKPNKQKGLLMKTKLVVFVAALCVAVLLSTSSAFAAGTPAGTVIKNVASMTYKDLGGTSFPTLYSDTAFTTVEQVAGVTLTPTGSLQYSSDSMYVYFPHTVTNTGNGEDTYNLTSADSASWSATILVDTDEDGVWDVGENTVIAQIEDLAADAEYKIIIRLFVPNETESGLLDTIRTTATSTFDNSIDPIASAWVRDSIRTRVAEISLSKTNDNGTPKPGETITYTIQYSNDGTGTGEGATLSDTLDANVTYVGGSATINSGGGSVAFLTSPNRIVWSNIGNSGDIYAGMTGELTFEVTVNANVPAGTIISNTAYLVYTDSISGRTKNPPGGPSTSTVEDDGAWQLTVSAISNSFVTSFDDDSVNVSDTMYFKLKLKNIGNRKDSATFARTSSIPLTWTLYRDVNSNGVYNSGTDLIYNLASDTTILNQGDSTFFIALAPVGQSVNDRRIDTARYIVSSVYLSAVDTGYHYSLIKAPVMTLTKGVTTQSGRSRPGDTLIYTITYTNTGSGSANQIVISDVSPTNTTYLAESVLINNSANGNVFTAKTDDDNSGDDEVVVSSGTITVSLGSVGSRLMGDVTHTGQIRFKVKIN